MAASPAVAAADAPPRVVENCRGVLRVLSDGTVVRSAPPVAEDVPADPSVEWKDVAYDAALGLSLRAYRPAATVAGEMLPVVVVFHGGGFCIGAYALPTFHAACTRLAAGTRAVVLSADYRLAPEHRLPAAIDDAAAVLLWLAPRPGRSRRRPMALRARRPGQGLRRRRVSGRRARAPPQRPVLLRRGAAPGAAPRVRPADAVLHGSRADPVRADQTCPDGAYLNRDMSARFLRLCLPAGATADHPFLNPFGPDSPALDAVAVGPTLVVVAGDDVLRDRNVEYVRRMEEMGKPVEFVESPGQGHAFFSLRRWAEPVDELVRVFKRFMDKVLSRAELSC